VDAVAGLSDAEDERPVRDQVLASANRALKDKEKDLPKDEWNYLKGRVLAMQDATPDAIEYYTLAVDLRPDKTQWRYELATLLQTIGRIEQAKEHAARCFQKEPKNVRYESLVRQLTREWIRQEPGPIDGSAL
jgi:tetratricopeptide (TPR) repeat protein